MKAKTKFTKLWSILLALAMVVGMLPIAALAAGSATETADFTDGYGTDALALLNAAKTPGAADSTWDPDTKTLTLKGVYFSTATATAVMLPKDATIVLTEGTTNTITGGSSSEDCFGIYAVDGLTIQGAGTLNVTGGDATGASKTSCGIFVSTGSVSITGGTVTATGGTTEGTYGVSYGIFAAIGSVNISGGKVEATGGTADGNSGNSYGIRANGSVSISGGEVEANGGKADSYSNGIYAENDVTIFGTADVTATGGASKNGKSNGIYADKDVSITGGTVTANGGTSQNGNSYGICAYSGSVSIQDTAVVTAQAGAAVGESLGIYTNSGSVTISGGTTVRATGGKGNLSNGIRAVSGSVSIQDTAVVTAQAGAETSYSYGIIASGVSITGGEVKATGSSGILSCGIFSSNNVTISGGEVEANGGTANNYSYGIRAGGSVSITGGSLIAQGKTSAMNQAPSLPGAYQWRTSATGTYTKNTETGYSWDESHKYLEIKTATGFTVTFDANGGTGTMADVTGVLGEYTLPANGFTAPTGMKFKCWSVGGTEKAVGDKITVSANTTVKAVWENITYTVTFDANGGTGTMADVTGISGEYTLPANGFTAPEGKQFKCWKVSDTEKAVGDNITVTADTTVKAVWETLPATPAEYDILDGANSSWTQDSDGNISVRGSGEFSEFVGVKVDGKSVDEKYYTVKEGSTIVTLKAGYLNTLTVGSHTLEIIWTDGSASTAFNVNAKSPQTGDNSMMALWIAVLFVSGFGVVATAVYGKKRKSVK